MFALPNLKPSVQEEVNVLHNIASIDHKSFQFVPASEQGPYVLASGIVNAKNRKIDLRTAISVQENELEYSTWVGNIPDPDIGAAVAVSLNQNYRGKFAVQKIHTEADLLYITTSPLAWVSQNLRREIYSTLEVHAYTLASVSNALDELEKIWHGNWKESAQRFSYYGLVDSVIKGNI